MRSTSSRARRVNAVGLVVVATLLATMLAAGPAAVGPSSASATQAMVEPESGYQVTPFRPRGSDDARLVKAWHAWQGREHQRYTTVVGRFCGCEPEPRVSTEVEADRVTSVHHLHEDEELARHGYEMDELFRILRAAYAEADDVDVRYLQGVPVAISIVYGARPSNRDTTMSVRVRRTDEATPYAYPVAPFRLREDDRPVLASAWRTWRASKIASYVVTTTSHGGEGTDSTVRTHVAGPVVDEVESADEQSAPRRGFEMERLYRMIRTLYRTADHAEVRFDDRGVPRRITADPIRGAVDDELVIRVRLRAS
ncbi:MAG: DUF6174 domain-containing protein [Nocardioides sp.]|uniref:DUF6174 domain-containing protein n=1 Tax=Nocardioides sp. TaxID=35761 RepID=UPI002394F722|nr:DUF6174 domain-containing protein [Nocardioides sp.]MDE0775190.1 DUF6174 domain-containing protein [Nocardioides sp.]